MSKVQLSPLIKDGSKPVHIEARERILALIESGQVGPGDRLPSEPDIAGELGISRMTVNKAILSLVADGWLERTKGKGTYVASAQPRKSLKAAVVIVEDLQGAINNYYFGAIYFGLIREGEAQGIQFEAIRLNRILDQYWEADRFDALVFINPPIEALMELEKRGLHERSVVIGASWPGIDFKCIDSDNIFGGLMVAEEFAKLGHRKTLFVGGRPGVPNSADRERGFTMGASLRGLETTLAPWSFGAINLSPDCEEFLRTTLKKKDRPTAIFAIGAVLALQVNRIFTDLGLVAGRDIALVAYDDPAFLEVAPVPIATVVQPFDDMVKRACSYLAGLLRDEEPHLPSTDYVRPTLMARQSLHKNN